MNYFPKNRCGKACELGDRTLSFLQKLNPNTMFCESLERGCLNHNWNRGIHCKSWLQVKRKGKCSLPSGICLILER